jgi:regulator of protease activity HflC (stomatin/prohibitin superfamily)
MNYEIITIMAIAIAISLSIGLAQLFKFRRAILVPEGYAGLLYHKGKFVKALDVGRHILWGRHYNWNVQDTRKAMLQVAGQEVLTADNVGLKASLLVTLVFGVPGGFVPLKPSAQAINPGQPEPT